MLNIAKLTFREVLSKKIFYIVLVLTAAYFIVYGVALHFLAADIMKYSGPVSIQKLVVYPQLLSLGLYFATFIVALLAVFSTVGAISAEIETGTIQGVITKPLKRHDFVLGKFMGYAAMLLLYSAVLYLGITEITALVTDFMPHNLIQGLLLFLIIPLILLVLGLGGSAILSTMANGITVFMLFIIGMVGGMVEQIGSLMNSTSLVSVGIISSLLMPSDAIYRKIIYNLLAGSGGSLNIFTASPFASKNPPSDAMVVYTLVYIAVVLIFTVRCFNKRDI